MCGSKEFLACSVTWYFSGHGLHANRHSRVAIDPIRGIYPVRPFPFPFDVLRDALARVGVFVAIRSARLSLSQTKGFETSPYLLVIPEFLQRAGPETGARYPFKTA